MTAKRRGGAAARAALWMWCMLAWVLLTWTATVEQLLRTYKQEFGESTAEQIFRLPVTAHLEQHLDQLERALSRDGSATTKPAP